MFTVCLGLLLEVAVTEDVEAPQGGEEGPIRLQAALPTEVAPPLLSTGQPAGFFVDNGISSLATDSIGQRSGARH